MSLSLPRHVELWLPGYLRSRAVARAEARARSGVIDILFAIVDHYEPLLGDASDEVGASRVRAWADRYPASTAAFVDADGRHPQHTFFYPIEQYRPELLEPLAALCGRGYGEVEIHLHHDRDDADHLGEQLRQFTAVLHDRHGLLTRDGSGKIRYAFIHGNWALSNSLPGGAWCGVDDELAVLRDTDCYADMTLPAAPSPAQVSTVNQIYYAVGAPAGPKAHDRGRRARVGQPASPDDLLLVQGPLLPSFRRAKWGIVPRLENSALHAGHPPTLARFEEWLSCGICVEGRPEWVFVKVHTHGAPESNAEMMLGPETQAFHRDLLAHYNDGQCYRLHYVTAREMVNIIHAAEDGKTGNPGQYRDYIMAPPSCRAGA